MKIRWYGHSCFGLEANDGTRIITDPFDEKVGYDLPNTSADIVTISHEHYDHDNTSAIHGNFKVVKTSQRQNINGITIEGINTYHDDDKGSKRGQNIIYKFIIDGITVCHLGDLGHMLDASQLESVKNVDVLLIPVGGIFTIDSNQAAELVNQISPKMIIPMHYKTDKLSFELGTVDNFTKHFSDVVVSRSNSIEIDNASPEGDKKVVLLDYK